MVVSEVWAEVEGHPNCGRVHFYKLGEPVEVQEPVEETTKETEIDAEPSRGIPGYPLWSIGVALAIFYLLRKK